MVLIKVEESKISYRIIRKCCKTETVIFCLILFMLWSFFLAFRYTTSYYQECYRNYPNYNRHNFLGKYSFNFEDEFDNYRVVPNRDDTQTAVIGFSICYNASYITVYLLSLLHTGYNGSVILFYDHYDEMYQKYPSNFYFLPMSKSYPYYPINEDKYYIPYDHLVNSIPHLNEEYGYFWHTIRFFILNTFLNHYGKLFTYIHFSDVRDVFFQINPFHWNYPEECVFLFEESSRLTIEKNKYAKEWISVLSPPYSIYNNTNINSGNIFGSYNELSMFLNDYTEYLSNVSYNTLKSTTEQGVLNVFYYLHPHFNYSVYFSHNERGMVRNFGLDISSGVIDNDILNEANLIVNNDGTIPCIVHQYFDLLRNGSLKRRNQFNMLISKCIVKHDPFDI